MRPCLNGRACQMRQALAGAPVSTATTLLYGTAGGFEVNSAPCSALHVRCAAAPEAAASSSAPEGPLHVLVGDTWLSVLARKPVSASTLHAACRSLGFKSGTAVHLKQREGKRKGSAVLLGGSGCTGAEPSGSGLLACRHKVKKQRKIKGGSQVHVNCTNAPLDACSDGAASGSATCAVDHAEYRDLQWKCACSRTVDGDCVKKRGRRACQEMSECTWFAKQVKKPFCGASFGAVGCSARYNALSFVPAVAKLDAGFLVRANLRDCVPQRRGRPLPQRRLRRRLQQLLLGPELLRRVRLRRRQ